VHDVEVIEDARAATVALDPVRARLLAELAVSPASAAALASRVDLPRQKVNYHLKELEAHGLIELAEVRRHGGISERVLQATAASYVVSPAAIAESGARPEQVADRLSARYHHDRGRPHRLIVAAHPKPVRAQEAGAAGPADDEFRRRRASQHPSPPEETA